MLSDKMIKMIGMGILRDKAGDPAPTGGPAPVADPAPGGNVTLTKEQFDALMARLPGKETPPVEDPTLADKVRKEQSDKDTASKREKSLESAIYFTHASKDFVKNNKSLLPETIAGIFDLAEKETYESAIEKANAIKVEIVKEFFSIQANHDLLTGSQKNQLDDFLKLTKTVKQDRIENIYSMIFEPTLETLRKVEKARQLNNGGKDQTDNEKQLADRMIKLSRKHYLGEKENA